MGQQYTHGSEPSAACLEELTSWRPLKAATASTSSATSSALLCSVNEDLAATEVLAAHAQGLGSTLKAVKLDVGKALCSACLSVHSCSSTYTPQPSLICSVLKPSSLATK